MTSPPPLSDALRAALTAAPPPRAAGRVASVLAFAWRALLKVRHTPEQLFDVVVTPVLFTVLFTYLFGGALAGSPEQYLQFLLPGILVQTVTFTCVYTGFTLNTDIGKGVFDRFRAMPVWGPAPLVGAMVGDMGRYALSALVVFAVGLVMGYRPPAGLPGVVLSIALLNLFAFGLGWIFTALALVVRSASVVMTFSWLVLMPLTFASNVYVDPATMPPWLQAVVAVNPVTLVVDALRALLDGAPSVGLAARALVPPAVITALFAPLCMRWFRRER